MFYDICTIQIGRHRDDLNFTNNLKCEKRQVDDDSKPPRCQNNFISSKFIVRMNEILHNYHIYFRIEEETNGSDKLK